MIIVSACLGLNTKYDGTTNAHALIQKYSALGKFIPVCPEQLGGLPEAQLVELLGDDEG